MAASLNKVLLMGNLTRDPEVKYTPKGTAVCDLGLAINDSYKAQDGTIKEQVTFVDVEVWGRTAENCKQYLSKGRPVFVEGQLRLDTWEQEGQNAASCVCALIACNFSAGADRVVVKVVAARAAVMVAGKVASGRSGGSSTSTGRTAQPSSSQMSEDRPPAPQDEDDIPF